MASLIETRCHKSEREKLEKERGESSMDESAKELLKHIQGLIKESATEVTTKLGTRSDAVERTVETISNDFNTWRPRLESRVDELQAAAVELRQQAGNKQPIGVSTAPVGGDPAAAHLADARSPDTLPLLEKQPAGTDLGQGHGESSIYQGATLGALAALAFTPVTGMINFQTLMSLCSAVFESDSFVGQLLAHLGQGNLSLQFPVFDGDNPHMWQMLAE